MKPNITETGKTADVVSAMMHRPSYQAVMEGLRERDPELFAMDLTELENTEIPRLQEKQKFEKLAAAKDILRYRKWLESNSFADGGQVELSAQDWFKSLNLSALPDRAAEYLQSQILSDPDIELLDSDDEDFIEIRSLIENDFPACLPGAAAAEPETGNAEPETELTLADYQASLDGAEIELEFAAKKDKKGIQDYIDGLKVMIDTLS